jgi:hypothetical protein
MITQYIYKILIIKCIDININKNNKLLQIFNYIYIKKTIFSTQ